MRRPFTILALAIAAWGLAPAAQAGRSCELQPASLQALREGLRLAEATAQRLDASGAQVVLLARAGQDLSAHDLQWSHLAFAYRPASEPNHPAAPWRVVHKLNHCGTDEAQVYRQGLGDFFLDHPHRYEAAFVVLNPNVQSRLLPLLQDNARLATWHSPRYSMLAYAWSTRYQQSNQWALETLAGALDDSANNRDRAQAWLHLKAYEPTPLHLSAFTRLAARTRANISFDDHPNSKRFADRIDTVTVDSMFAWAEAGAWSGPPQLVR